MDMKCEKYDMYEKVRACSLVLDSELFKLKVRDPKHSVSAGVKLPHGEYSGDHAGESTCIPGNITLQKRRQHDLKPSFPSLKQRLQGFEIAQKGGLIENFHGILVLT